MYSPTFGFRSPEPPRPNVQEQQAQQLEQWARDWEQEEYARQGPFPIPAAPNLVRMAQDRVRARGEAASQEAVAAESRSLYEARQAAQARGRERREARQGPGPLLQQPPFAAGAASAQWGVPARNPIRDEALRTQPDMPPGDAWEDMRPATPRRTDARTTQLAMPQGYMPPGDNWRDTRPVTPPANGADGTSRPAANGTPSPQSSPRQSNAGTRYQPYPTQWQRPSGHGPRRPGGPSGAGGAR